MKLKVWVTDDDLVFDDDVDGLVYLLRRTPSRSYSTASWNYITMRGQRDSYRTRSVDVFFLAKFIRLCAVRVRIYFTFYCSCIVTPVITCIQAAAMSNTSFSTVMGIG